MSSSDNPAIRVQGVSKRYDLDTQAGSDSLYDRVGRLLRRDIRSREYLWALEDVTFDVPTGKVVAVLGRNGSGKSTLMRLIAQVALPTVGRIEVRGRVGALLQVGTGFHPELTGRENIRLSGALLGMDEAAISAHEENIVKFAQVGDHIDAPVKHYSSGMYLRLAFSVSVYLDTDILLLDEVLSVGDGDFQVKSQAKVRDIVRDGRTVLFSSHYLPAVRSLCDLAIVLVDGRLVFEGEVGPAVDYYERKVLQSPPTAIM